MAKTKAGGSTQNIRDSQPKYLGIKLQDGERAHPGAILARQRGTKILAGKNVKIGKDHTLYAVKEGVVRFSEIRKKRFDGKTKRLKKISVLDDLAA